MAQGVEVGLAQGSNVDTSEGFRGQARTDLLLKVDGVLGQAGADISIDARDLWGRVGPTAVSYTHLTLPTILLV